MSFGFPFSSFILRKDSRSLPSCQDVASVLTEPLGDLSALFSALVWGKPHRSAPGMWERTCPNVLNGCVMNLLVVCF
jgi:hypothetical protein